jgi:hypothetical protein
MSRQLRAISINAHTTGMSSIDLPRPLIKPRVVGNDPVSWLDPKSITSRFVKEPNSEGIVENKAFSKSARCSGGRIHQGSTNVSVHEMTTPCSVRWVQNYGTLHLLNVESSPSSVGILPKNALFERSKRSKQIGSTRCQLTTKGIESENRISTYQALIDQRTLLGLIQRCCLTQL